MQLKLLTGTWSKHRYAFGGDLLKGSHPKTKRHFRPSLPLHVVVRSAKARFFLNNRGIGRILEQQAGRHHVRLYAVANAGNHIHLLLQAPGREELSNFLRAITGRIAELANVKWDARPFSRIVSWGREFKRVLRYVGGNAIESLGISRASAQRMFEDIHRALSNGLVQKTPGLVAMGFS